MYSHFNDYKFKGSCFLDGTFSKNNWILVKKNKKILFQNLKITRNVLAEVRTQDLCRVKAT